MEMENYGISKAYFATLERVNQKVKAFRIIYIYIYIGFPPYFFKTFNQRVITVRDKKSYSGVNRWPMKFFQSAGTRIFICLVE